MTETLKLNPKHVPYIPINKKRFSKDKQAVIIAIDKRLFCIGQW